MLHKTHVREANTPAGCDAPHKLPLLLVALFLFQATLFAIDINTCQTLSTANTLYTLNTSIVNGSSCFTITGANITLDCAGYSITGNNTSSTFGVGTTTAADNSTIKNCIISDFPTGIALASDAFGNATIINNTIKAWGTGTAGVGIDFQSGFSTVSQTTINASYRAIYGILNNCTIANSSFNAISNSGVFINGGAGCVFYNLNITANNTGLLSNTANATGWNLNITSYTASGISATNFNRFYNSTLSAWGAGSALSIGGYNTTFDNITGVGNGTGYGLSVSGANFTISNSNFTNIESGTNTRSAATFNAGGNKGKIYNTTFFGYGTNGFGIYLTSADDNTFYNTTAYARLGNAVRFRNGANNNSFYGLTASGGGAIGLVSSDGGDNNTVDCQGGTLSGNKTTSQYVLSATTGATNSIYKNCIAINGYNNIYSSGAVNQTFQNITTFNATSSEVYSYGGTNEVFDRINSTSGVGQPTFYLFGTTGTNVTVKNSFVEHTGSQLAIRNRYVGADIHNNTLLANSNAGHSCENINQYVHDNYINSTSGSAVTLSINSTIANNTLYGGVYAYGQTPGETTPSYALVADNNITNNAGTAHSFILQGSGTSLINNLTFTRNRVIATAGGGLVRLYGANHMNINISDNYFENGAGITAFTLTAIINSTIRNNTINMTSANYVFLPGSDFGNDISNNRIWGGSSGIVGSYLATSSWLPYLTTYSNNTFYNLTTYGIWHNGHATLGNTTPQIYRDNYINASNTGVRLAEYTINQQFYNNTFVGSTTGIYIGATGVTNNTFLGNNITAGTWVNDLNGGNFYNDSTTGNIYYYTNGTPIWEGLNGSNLNSSVAGFYWSDSGFCVNATNWGSMITGGVGDCHAYTLNAGAPANTPPEITGFNITSRNSTPNFIISFYDDIGLNLSALDNQTTTMNVSYEWYKNGVLFHSGVFTGLPNATAAYISNLTRQNYTVGDNMGARLNASDGTNETGWVSVLNLTVIDRFCTNSTTAEGSCLNTTIKDGVNWSVLEPSGIPYNGTVRIYDTSLTEATFDLNIFGNYQATPTPHDIEVFVYNWSAGAWWNTTQILDNNGLSWTNITGLAAADFLNSSESYYLVMFWHPSNGNPAHYGFNVDYIDAEPVSTDAVSANITFPTSYSQFFQFYPLPQCQAWLPLQLNITTNVASGNGTCFRYYASNGSLLNSSTFTFTNGSNLINITLQNSESGVFEFINCTLQAGVATNSTQTEGFIPQSLGQSSCTATPGAGTGDYFLLGVLLLGVGFIWIGLEVYKHG